MSEPTLKKRVAIVGAQGYSGLELARILLHHPKAELCGVFSRDTDWRLEHDLPDDKAHTVPTHQPDQLLAVAETCDTVFLATPADVSMQLAAALAPLAIQCIDLSGAFRLTVEEFESWYGEAHTASAPLAEAVYGLSPWLTQKQAPNAHALIANPGCYPTAALMGLVPLLEAGIIDSKNLIIDAKSGVSGAGRIAKKPLLLAEMQQNFYPYKIGKHQHTPEIIRYLQSVSARPVSLHFSTHLLPIKRGISVSIYADLIAYKRDINRAIQAVYDKAYQEYPLARYGALDEATSAEQLQLTSLCSVVGSARTHIAWQQVETKLQLFVSIDNLLKGAASQAVENFNQLNGFKLATGLVELNGTL